MRTAFKRSLPYLQAGVDCARLHGISRIAAAGVDSDAGDSEHWLELTNGDELHGLHRHASPPHKHVAVPRDVVPPALATATAARRGSKGLD